MDASEALQRPAKIPIIPPDNRAGKFVREWLARFAGAGLYFGATKIGVPASHVEKVEKRVTYF